jgi:AraC family transcriptional regulator of adaptative response/methylated-DNA-[protein]-cysteine methyltransferase
MNNYTNEHSQYLTVDYARKILNETRNIKYQNIKPSVEIKGISPREYKKHGHEIKIGYGFYDSPFGKCLISVTDEGICGLSFIDEASGQVQIERLRSAWCLSEVVPDNGSISGIGENIFEKKFNGEKPASLRCFLKGTPFQLKVWEALTKVPFGFLTCYQEIAVSCGLPSASRAVAGAIGSNPVAYLIPCHRIIHKSGDFSGYYWGIVRKKAMIGWEAATRYKFLNN